MSETTGPSGFSPGGELLLRCLDSSDGDPTGAMEALCREHPGQASVLRELYGLLDRLGLVPEPGSTRTKAARERIGRYRLLELLGSGGMGMVYRAEDEELGRKVALKVIHHGLADTPRARERFRREALAAARLDHPGICPVYEIGDVDGVPFLAMRHVPGQSLQQVIARSHAAGRPIVALPRNPADGEQAAVLRFVEQAAHALHAAHEAGLVHRDVKPGNLIVTPEGAPVLVDFGLARLEDSDHDALTMTGDQLGTPSYMAPEQIAGRPADRRTDVYALGVVLYECLALRLPFDAPNRHDLQSQILHEEPPDPRTTNRTIGRELWTVLQTALAKDPAHRYRSAAAFAEDLRRLRMHEPILARRASPWVRIARYSRRHPVAVGVLLLLATSLLVFAVLLRQRTDALLRADAALRTSAATVEAVRAVAAASTSPADALVRALAAVRAERTVETVAALGEVLVQHHERLRLEHGRSTWEAAWSADGERFATTSDNGMAQVWDRRGESIGRLRHNLLPGHGAQPVYSVDFAAVTALREPCWVTGSMDGSARVLGSDGRQRLLLDHRTPANQVSAKPMGLFSIYDPGALPEVQMARFSPDGRWIATSCSDRLVRVWDVASGRLCGEPLAGHCTGMVVLAWSSTGLLASADNMDLYPHDRTGYAVRLWRPAGDRFAADAVLPVPASIMCVAFAPHGDALAAACQDGFAHVWELTPQGPREPLRLPHDDMVNAVDFAPDGQRILTAGSDRKIRLWSRRGDLLGETSLDGRCKDARFAGGTAAAGELRILATSADQTVRVFDAGLHLQEVLRGHTDLTWDAKLSPDGRTVLSTSWDGTARLWQLFDPELPRLHGHRARVCALRLLPDGRIVSVADDRTARLWDLATGRGVAQDLGVSPWSLDVSVDGTRLLVGGLVGTVREFEAASGRLLRSHDVPFTQWAVARYLGSDRILAAGRGTVQLLDGDEARPWGKAGEVYAVCRAARRGILAGGNRGYVVPLWREDGQQLPHLAKPEPSWVVSLAWSPDERRLAAGAATGGEVWVWEVPDDPGAAGAPQRLPGHGGAIRDVAWSPSGRWLAAAVSDGSAHLWDVRAGERVAILRGHRGTGVSAVLFPRDDLLLTGGDDGAIQGWPITVDELIALAEARIVQVRTALGSGNEFDFLLTVQRFAEALAIGERWLADASSDDDARPLSWAAARVVAPARGIPQRAPELLGFAERAARRALELAAEPDHAMLATMARVWSWKGDHTAALEWQQRAVAACPEHPAAVRRQLLEVLEEYRALAATSR